MRELHDEAVGDARPVQTVVYGVVDGLVCVYDLVAVPLSNRRELSLCMVCIEERERNFSLVEAMFQATKDGLLALAVIRDTLGAPSDFQIAALNDGAARLMQGTAEDLPGHRLSEMCIALPTSGLLPRLIAVFNGGGSARFELDCSRDSGGYTYFNVSASTMGDLVFLTLTDVSDLKARKGSFKLLFEGNPVPMWLHDNENMKFLAVNDAAIAHYGYDRESFLALAFVDILPEGDREKVMEAIRQKSHVREGRSHVWQHLRADGTTIDVITYWRDTNFGGRPAQLVAVIDVTEKRQAEKRLAYMARHDALTGLPNRMLFHERLEEALLCARREKEKLAVLYLDLDHFKNVNDTLGYPVGDKLLMAAAERLRSCVRDCDMVARFGGDEFAVLQMPLAGPHEASALADRIIKLMSERYDIEGQQIVAGASAGIAFAPADGDEPDLLLKNADLALYLAKDLGRNTFRFFDPASTPAFAPATRWSAICVMRFPPANSSSSTSLSLS